MPPLCLLCVDTSEAEYAKWPSSGQAGLAACPLLLSCSTACCYQAFGLSAVQTLAEKQE